MPCRVCVRVERAQALQPAGRNQSPGGADYRRLGCRTTRLLVVATCASMLAVIDTDLILSTRGIGTGLGGIGSGWHQRHSWGQDHALSVSGAAAENHQCE